MCWLDSARLRWYFKIVLKSGHWTYSSIMHGKNPTTFLLIVLTSATTITSSQGDGASPHPILFPEVMSEWFTDLSWSSPDPSPKNPDPAEPKPFSRFWDIPRTTCTLPPVLPYTPPARLKKHKKGPRHGNMPRHWRPGHNNQQLHSSACRSPAPVHSTVISGLKRRGSSRPVLVWDLGFDNTTKAWRGVLVPTLQAFYFAWYTICHMAKGEHRDKKNKMKKKPKQNKDAKK